MKNNGQTTENNPDSGILSNPLSFPHSGYVYVIDAGLHNRGYYGLYWSLHSIDTTASYGLFFHTTGLHPQNYDYRGFGFAVRCVITPNGLVVSLPILYVQKAGNYLLTQATNPSPLSLILAIL